MKLLIFGTGKFYQKKKQELLDTDKIEAFVDNRANEIGSFEDKKVYHPNEIKKVAFDYIIVMATDYKNIREQLHNIGIDDSKILDFEEYISISKRAFQRILVAKGNSFKKILVISEPLLFNGGAMAAVNASLALTRRGYSVDITVAHADSAIIEILRNAGIGLIICPHLPYINQDDVDIFCDYDIALVNVFPMIRVACELSKRVPVLWWLHESSDKYNYFYKNTRQKHYRYDNASLFNNIRIAAVSTIAKNVFESIYERKIDCIFPVGINDESLSSKEEADVSTIVFATLGTVAPAKGQLDVINAIKLLKNNQKEVEYKIIGAIGDDDYEKKIKESSELQVSLEGVLNRDELVAQRKKINVVICASYEETLCLSVVEGMMDSKICITTDETGIAEYIEDGVNGFVYKAGDINTLAKKLQYIINHLNELDDMREKARDTYEKYFTLDILADNIEREIELTIDNYTNHHNM
ncbi:Glycosyltransferase involved in cell wall bisynthesis [Pseudobutyrivibrio sp. OR37]|uniref:glycosyltransferase family 4 protein n=1 Tax=Pseudobutyrivibrio sp. OR37 TaxID=1798186 RepID=UPI0008EBF0C5|nr:glycosyltransferase family 4 protein [Pseudobutyrivibrio sp. OR37]SFI08384.1 Glycosyltransferase involved in cell wall bisynthesis [Pseudobutyrivibrio sp. OR37]